MSDYKYLFPYEKIPQNSRVVIYGAGEVGWEYFRQLCITRYAKVVGVVDRKAGDIKNMPIKLLYPSELQTIQYDYIVLAFKASAYYNAVRKELILSGIDEEKIVYISARKEPNYEVLDNSVPQGKNKEYSYDLNCISIAIKLGAAIGDNIIQKNFVKAIAELDSKIRIDIYSPVSDAFLPWLYSDCPNVNIFIQDGGSFYAQQYSKYDFSFQIWILLKIDHINEEKLRDGYVDFYNKVKMLERKIKETDMDYNMPMYTFYARSIKQGKNAYTVYDFDGEFYIKDRKTSIKLDKDFEIKTKKELPRQYITVNYGNGISMTNAKMNAKQWPYEYFETFIKKFVRCYPDVMVVQLGATGAYKLKGICTYVIGKPLETVACVLNNSLLHIDIEGGLVHLATQLGTKCLVLFGPTQEEFFGYEQNINIKAGKCHDCYGMYLDHTRCARDMERPECMYSITPQMVLGKVEEYLKTCEEM